MRLWTPCRIVGRLLDGFNEKLSLWQREEASLRKIIMQYEYGLRIIAVEVLINSLIALCSQETVLFMRTMELCCVEMYFKFHSKSYFVLSYITRL